MAYNQPQQRTQPQLTHQVAKTATAVTIGGSLTLLSGLTMATTVIGLVLATPVLVISSPVWVPATIFTLLLVAGFFTSGGFAATSVAVLYWMYRYATGQHPVGADRLDRARAKIASAAGEMKDKAEQFGHEHITGGSGT